MKKIYGLYFKDGEEDLIKHICPEYYVDNDFLDDKIDLDFLKRFLQNQLHQLLNSYLNGGFSNKGFVLYPYVKDVSVENKLKLKRLRKVIKILNDNGVDFSSSLEYFKNEINNENFAIFLSNLYYDFSKINFNKLKSVTKTKCDVVESNKSIKGLDKFANKYLKKYLSGFYLHGSYATDDFVKGWSDLDTLGIVSKNTIKAPFKLEELRDKLYEVRKYYLDIDPLQHHGTKLITEIDINNYCQSYFPVEIFKYSKSFFDDKNYYFKLRDFSSENLYNMFYWVSHFRGLVKNNLFRLNSYDSKFLYHGLTLFPSLYLQSDNVVKYKKYSFDLVKKEFENNWDVVDKVSSIRDNWKSYGTFKIFKMLGSINPVFYFKLNSLIVDFYDKRMVNKKLIIEMHKLLEIGWGNVKKKI